MNKRVQVLSWATFLLGSLMLIGCGQDGPATVPVYGTVSIAGREMPPVCRIFFQPVAKTTTGPVRPSVAEMQPDGSYEVKAFRQSDGLVPGTYQIRLTYFDLKPGANPDLESSWIENSFDAGELVVEADSGGVEHDIEIQPNEQGA